jgi:NAD(P) transhydrogenase subunit alpha
VDLAAESGGNCELTKPGETISVNGVTIIGTLNIPATMPMHASQMYARNVVELLKLLITKEGKLNLDFNDEIIKDACLTHAGQDRRASR